MHSISDIHNIKPDSFIVVEIVKYLLDVVPTVLWLSRCNINQVICSIVFVIYSQLIIFSTRSDYMHPSLMGYKIPLFGLNSIIELATKGCTELIKCTLYIISVFHFHTFLFPNML